MDNDRGLALFILGGVSKYFHIYEDYIRYIFTRCNLHAVFLPGSYSSFILFGAWRRWRGFTYDMVPSYDD